MSTKRVFGWKKNPIDERDFKFSMAMPRQLPPLVDLSNLLPPCFDQGQLSSCTGNATAAAIQFDEIKQKGIIPEQAPIPSRLFIYYTGRVLEGSQDADNGCCIRDIVKAVNITGFPPEALWDYVESNVDVEPPRIAYSVAIEHCIKVYKNVNQTIQDLKICLVSGYPIIFGMQVFPSIAEAETSGILPMPKEGEFAEGGHCVLIVGYDDSKQAFLVRNSWGTQWGQNGYFWASYSYILNPNLCSDFTCINSI
jgi:C1A family cysteine protease